jgi:hypothetical protein
LLIDPTILDPTPRLPIWTIRTKDGSAGWTQDNWPAIQRGGAWVLKEGGWKSIDEKKEKYLTEVASPASAPATTQPGGPPLWIDPDGTAYFGGTDALTVASPSGHRTFWPLPARASGIEPVTLIKADGKLFLFNQPGRVVRLSITPTPATPFKLDAVFTRNVPNSQPTRIWLDPAGRLCAVADGNLYVMFPNGAIPRDISDKMTTAEQKANEPE